MKRKETERSCSVVLPIDRLPDTVRTAVNVEGDMIGSPVVQRFEGLIEQSLVSETDSVNG